MAKYTMDILSLSLQHPDGPAGWAVEINGKNGRVLSGGLPEYGAHFACLYGVCEALDGLPSGAEVRVRLRSGCRAQRFNAFVRDRKIPDCPRPEFWKRLEYYAGRISLSFEDEKKTEPSLLRLVKAAHEGFCAELEELPFALLYTDGCGLPCEGVGGWGARIEYPRTKKIRRLVGAATQASAQEMERAAILAALEALPEKTRVLLFYDSKNVLTALNACPRFTELMAARHHILTPVWIPGHCGIAPHDECDVMAGKAARAAR